MQQEILRSLWVQPTAGEDVAERKGDEDGQPIEADADVDPDEAATVPHMHEEQHERSSQLDATCTNNFRSCRRHAPTYGWSERWTGERGAEARFEPGRVS